MLYFRGTMMPRGKAFTVRFLVSGGLASVHPDTPYAAVAAFRKWCQWPVSVASSWSWGNLKDIHVIQAKRVDI